VNPTSYSESPTLKEQLAHFAYHAKTNPLYNELLTSSSSALFYDDLKKRLFTFFGDQLHFKNERQFPHSFLSESVVSGFLNIVSYWLT
jgi:hypothetical protein